MIANTRYHGIIVYYNSKGGYGFIKPDITGEEIPDDALKVLNNDIFFHCSQYEHDRISPGKGREVSFELKEGSRRKRTYNAHRILEEPGHRLEKILGIFSKLPKRIAEESAEERSMKQIAKHSKSKYSKYFGAGNHYMMFVRRQKLDLKSFDFDEAIEVMYGRIVRENSDSISVKGYFADLSDLEQNYKDIVCTPQINGRKSEQLMKKSLERLSEGNVFFEFAAKKENIVRSFDVLPADYLVFDAKQRSNYKMQ
jgi:cold shock CspA family protein